MITFTLIHLAYIKSLSKTNQMSISAETFSSSVVGVRDGEEDEKQLERNSFSSNFEAKEKTDGLLWHQEYVSDVTSVITLVHLSEKQSDNLKNQAPLKQSVQTSLFLLVS